MLFSILFPIADSRNFLKKRDDLLKRPVWPVPKIDSDFVRSFGIVRNRPLGGISGWIGESVICEAHRAIRFEGLPNYKDIHSNLTVPLKVAYRRFYFDGLAVAKYEIGIVAKLDGVHLTRQQNRDLLYHLCNLQITIQNPLGEATHHQLWNAGKALTKLYLLSSIYTKHMSGQEEWKIQSCTPRFCIVTRPDEDLQLPFWSKNVSTDPFRLMYYTIPFGGNNIGLWGMHSSFYSSFEGGLRSLRISLLRLYAEQTCLRQILEHIWTNKIIIATEDLSFDILQYYLNRSISTIGKQENKANEICGNNVAEISRGFQEIIAKGERDLLLETLNRVNIRLNVLRKVQQHVNKDIHIHYEEKIMGDQYNIEGQAFGVGPGAQAHHIDFNQIWNDHGNSIDLEKLATELAVLRNKLKERATNPEHDIAIAEIAKAEIQAKKGDGSKVLEYLAKTGIWVLDAAKDIGTDVAAAVIKKSLGIP